MLSLKQKVGSGFVLQDENGKEIGRIHIADRFGNHILFGFDFPKEIKIYRTELLEDPETEVSNGQD